MCTQWHAAFLCLASTVVLVPKSLHPSLPPSRLVLYIPCCSVVVCGVCIRTLSFTRCPVGVISIPSCRARVSSVISSFLAFCCVHSPLSYLVVVSVLYLRSLAIAPIGPDLNVQDRISGHRHMSPDVAWNPPRSSYSSRVKRARRCTRTARVLL